MVVWSAAVGNDLLVSRQLGEAPLQGRQGNVEGARQMAEHEFVLRAHVEHRHQPVAQTDKQVLTGERLHLVASTEVGRHDPLDLGCVAFAHTPERVQ